MLVVLPWCCWVCCQPWLVDPSWTFLLVLSPQTQCPTPGTQQRYPWSLGMKWQSSRISLGGDKFYDSWTIEFTEWSYWQCLDYSVIVPYEYQQTPSISNPTCIQLIVRVFQIPSNLLLSLTEFECKCLSIKFLNNQIYEKYKSMKKIKSFFSL